MEQPAFALAVIKTLLPPLTNANPVCRTLPQMLPPLLTNAQSDLPAIALNFPFPPPLTNAQPCLPRHAVHRAGLDLKDARSANAVDSAGGERVLLDRQSELCAGKAGIVPAAMSKSALHKSCPHRSGFAYR